jgi:hypothetical protein
VLDAVKRNLPYAVNEVNDKAYTLASQSVQTATTGLDEQTVSSAAAGGITPMVTEDATQSPVLGKAAPAPFKYAGDAATSAEEATLATTSVLKSPEQATPGATARALAKKNTCTDNDCQKTCRIRRRSGRMRQCRSLLRKRRCHKSLQKMPQITRYLSTRRHCQRLPLSPLQTARVRATPVGKAKAAMAYTIVATPAAGTDGLIQQWAQVHQTRQAVERQYYSLRLRHLMSQSFWLS